MRKKKLFERGVVGAKIWAVLLAPRERAGVIVVGDASRCKRDEGSGEKGRVRGVVWCGKKRSGWEGGVRIIGGTKSTARQATADAILPCMQT